MANEELKIRNLERAKQYTYELVLHNGIENTSKEMLSRSSGISRSSLDRYFADKTDCILQTAEWVAHRLSERMSELSVLVDEGNMTGVKLFREYLEGRRRLYYEQKNLFVAIAELRVFISRNCEDSVQAYDKLTKALGFKEVLCRILSIGKADGTLLSDIDEQEESVYINGFYREMLVNLALTKNISPDEETRMIDGFIGRMVRYYQSESTRK